MCVECLLKLRKVGYHFDGDDEELRCHKCARTRALRLAITDWAKVVKVNPSIFAGEMEDDG